MSHPVNMEGLMDAAVDHVTSKAPFYFEFVQGHGKRGVVWLVLVAKEGGQLGVKSLSFLPVEAVELGDATALLKMYHSYDVASQFLCWYTIEGTDGRPLYSRVVVVDSAASVGASSLPDSTPHNPAPEPEFVPPQGSRAPSRHSQHGGEYHSLPPPSQNVALAHPTPRQYTSQSPSSFCDARQPSTCTVDLQNPPSADDGRPSIASASASQPRLAASQAPGWLPSVAPPPHVDATGAPPARSQSSPDSAQLLKMMLEVAEAAGKTGVAVDELNAKVLEVSERQNVIDQGMAALLTDNRTAFLENKVAQLEATVRDLQKRLAAGAGGAGGAPVPAENERTARLEGKVAELEEVIRCLLHPPRPDAEGQQGPNVRPQGQVPNTGAVLTDQRTQDMCYGSSYVHPTQAAAPAAAPTAVHTAPPPQEAAPEPASTSRPPSRGPKEAAQAPAARGGALDDMIARFEAKLNAMSKAAPGALALG